MQPTELCAGPLDSVLVHCVTTCMHPFFSFEKLPLRSSDTGSRTALVLVSFVSLWRAAVAACGHPMLAPGACPVLEGGFRILIFCGQITCTVVSH